MLGLGVKSFSSLFLQIKQLIPNTAAAAPICKMSSASSETELQNFAKLGKKILGAAYNYTDGPNAANLPKEPVLFLKPSSSYLQADSGGDILLPKVLTSVFHEVELGVIIGKPCRNVSEADAMSYVAGYCLALDLSATCQLDPAIEKGHSWSMGKGFDTATPVSRFIGPDEIGDPHTVQLQCLVDGVERQCGNTKDLLHKIPALISYASRFMTLERMDLLLTGTPKGAARIEKGNVVECLLGGNIVTMKFNVANGE